MRFTTLRTRIAILGLSATSILIILNASLLRWHPGIVRRFFGTEIRYGRDTADVHEQNVVTMAAREASSYASNEASQLEVSAKEPKPKLILFFTALFGRHPWPGLEFSYNFTHWANKPCAVRSCKITYDKSDLAHSDVVIFHSRDLPRKEKMDELSKRRPPKQKWLFFNHESPNYLYFDPAMYNGLFNWTMSYRRDSDFFLPYRTYTRLGSDDRAPEPGKNYAVGKDKLAVWLVSHCGLERENFTRNLMRYIPVDVFGSCTRKFNQTQRCRRFSPECDLLLKRYKFHFSFENSFCTDYISEKYWKKPFEHNIVPVVMGGANYDSTVAVPGSFINVVDFPSIKALADYLIYLNGNDTAYSQFFQWKSKFKTVLPESWTCKLCAALNNKTLVDTNTVYHNLHEIWAAKHACGKNEDKIREMILTDV